MKDRPLLLDLIAYFRAYFKLWLKEELLIGRRTINRGGQLLKKLSTCNDFAVVESRKVVNKVVIATGFPCIFTN